MIFNVKKIWFDKIKSGEKTHEYREVKPYWENRLRYPIHLLESGEIKTFPADIVLGYPKRGDFSKIIEVEILSIKIINGKNTDLKIDEPVYDIEFKLVSSDINYIPKGRKTFKEIEVQSTQFDKVRTVRLDPDDMEIVNISTGIDAFRECNWCDLSEFEQIEEDIKNGDDSKAHLIDFVSDEEYAALKDGTIDYIVFRIDY